MSADWKLTLLMVCVCGCGRPPVPQVAEILAPVGDGNVAVTGAVSQLPEPTFAPADWPAWRGVHCDGVAGGPAAPVEWSETKNVVWKLKLPGRGHSSPIILGDRVFLETADDGQQTQSVVGIDRLTGKGLWQTKVLQNNFEPSIHRENTHASCTLASDGERLFAAFLNDRRIYCSALTLEGEEIWRQEVGGFSSRHGYSASPVVYQGLVIVAADHEQGGVIAGLDRGTGHIIWRRNRPRGGSYASPRVVTLGGKDQVVLSGCGKVMSYDPLTGADNWSVDGTTEATVGSPVVSGDRVIVSGGYPGSETLAVDGAGNVSWRIREKTYVPSLLAWEGSLYMVQDDGIAHCFDAATGKEQWKHRLGGGYRASPLLCDGKVYVTDMTGKTTIFAANPRKFERIAENQLGSEGWASPAVSNGELFLRTADDVNGRRQEWLYCIAAASADPK